MFLCAIICSVVLGTGTSPIPSTHAVGKLSEILKVRSSFNNLVEKNVFHQILDVWELDLSTTSVHERMGIGRLLASCLVNNIPLNRRLAISIFSFFLEESPSAVEPMADVRRGFYELVPELPKIAAAEDLQFLIEFGWDQPETIDKEPLSSVLEAQVSKVKAVSPPVLPLIQVSVDPTRTFTDSQRLLLGSVMYLRNPTAITVGWKGREDEVVDIASYLEAVEKELFSESFGLFHLIDKDRRLFSLTDNPVTLPRNALIAVGRFFALLAVTGRPIPVDFLSELMGEDHLERPKALIREGFRHVVPA